MASAREIKKRIRSVKNIGQIARALEAEAATKVRRAQARALASRAYAEKAWEILLNVQSAAQGGGGAMHPLLTEREEIKKIMIVLITSDRGLCGAYNTNIIRVAQRFAYRMGKPVEWVTVGKKGRDSLIRARENVVAEFTNLPQNASISDLKPIAQIAIEAFLSGEVDDVFIAYTDFVNTLTQSPVVLGWLPLVPHTVQDQVAAEYIKEVPQVTTGGQDYEYEPNPQSIIDEIVPRFTELQLYQAFLESLASEYSARMIAMRSASDNASQLADDLTLEYNKARQTAITSEILDIVGGAEALQDTIDKTASDIERSMEKTAKQAKSASSNGSNGKSQKVAPSAPKATKSKPEKSADPDDLTKIEGIGAKMSAALIDGGIDTYEKLANASEAELQKAIEDAGMRLAPSIPTWAEQASYAAKGDWQGLEEFQSTLTAGRKE